MIDKINISWETSKLITYQGISQDKEGLSGGFPSQHRASGLVQEEGPRTLSDGPTTVVPTPNVIKWKVFRLDIWANHLVEINP